MELFRGKSLSQVTFQELRRELGERALTEGFYVDYKEDFPERLPKCVASFANSHGGYIFIGVREDPVRKTAAEFCGIALAADVSERARNLLHSHVSPFPPVEIATIRLPDVAGRGIVVIRVVESSVAPHICSDGKVYVRNLDASEPADPIKDRFTLDRLYDRSQHSEDDLARRRARTITYGKVHSERSGLDQRSEPARSMVVAVVIYPSGLSGSHALMLDGTVRRQAALIHGGSGVFRTLRDGVALVSGHGDLASTTEWWKAHDLRVAYEDGLIEFVQRIGSPQETLPLPHFVTKTIDWARGHATFLQRNCGYCGTVEVELHLMGVWGVRFVAEGGNGFWSRPSCQCDHGRVVHRMQLSPLVFEGEENWAQVSRPRLIQEVIDALMSEAGALG